MSEVPLAERREEVAALAPYASLIVTPGLEPSLIEVPAQTAYSVILVTNSLGSLPENLHDTIRNLVASGKPVFCIPDTTDTVLELSGELEQKTKALGVTYLPGVNVSMAAAVCAVVKEVVAQGLRGESLRDAVVNAFPERSS